MRELTRVFKALGDETRLQLMALLLREGELCVCDCVQALGTSQSKTSRHLRYLLNAGLVVDRREGLWVHYCVSPQLDASRSTIVATLDALLDGERSAEALEGLARWRAHKALEGPGLPPVSCCSGEAS